VLVGRLPPVRQVQVGEGSKSFQERIDDAVGNSLATQRPMFMNMVNNSVVDVLRHVFLEVPGYKGPVHTVASTQAQGTKGKDIGGSSLANNSSALATSTSPSTILPIVPPPPPGTSGAVAAPVERTTRMPRGGVNRIFHLCQHFDRYRFRTEMNLEKHKNK
jgi:hypothetical protein